MKHKYPKNRKKAIKRNSQKHRLLAKYPIEFIERRWIENGMYEGARILGNSNPFVLYHLAKEMKWIRQIPPHLLKAVKNNYWEISQSHYIPQEEVENV